MDIWIPNDAKAQLDYVLIRIIIMYLIHKFKQTMEYKTYLPT